MAIKTREDGAEAVFPAAEHGGNMVASKIVIAGPQPADCGGHVGRPVGWGDEQGGRLFRRWRVGGGRVMGDRAERVEERGNDIGGWGWEFEPIPELFFKPLVVGERFRVGKQLRIGGGGSGEIVDAGSPVEVAQVGENKMSTGLHQVAINPGVPGVLRILGMGERGPKTLVRKVGQQLGVKAFGGVVR